MRSALVLTLLIASTALAGCAKPDNGEATSPGDGNDTSESPSPSASARFEVGEIAIVPAGDANRTTLYEDDEGALVRYVVRQPAEAGKETAFVTYLLNGRIVDVQQLTLEAGQERAYERAVGDLRENRTIRVEVRAGSAVARAEAKVQDWPRAGNDALALGPLSVRADYGLLQQDTRALVNLTIQNEGEQTVRDFRVKMLCLAENGTIEPTSSVRLDAPTPGNETSVDVSVEDCKVTRYGLEFKGTGQDGQPLVGRLLLVPKGWRPAGTEA